MCLVPKEVKKEVLGGGWIPWNCMRMLEVWRWSSIPAKAASVESLSHHIPQPNSVLQERKLRPRDRQLLALGPTTRLGRAEYVFF